MNEYMNIAQLGRLLNNLHKITGLKFALMDYHANEIYTSNYKNRFCEHIADSPEGYQRCVSCDNAQLRSLRPADLYKQYRCHAGLIEVAIPVTENDRIVGMVLLGQLLSDGDIGAQWERTRALCYWHRDIEALKKAFYQLRRISQEDIRACGEIVMACLSEVRWKGLLETSAMTDFQRLALYIEQHYMERLSLDNLSLALNIGKTKLCNLASREAGATITHLIAEKRVAVAKGMLVSTDESVQRIAEAVGIPDDNYFTKVFKKTTGTTPLRYRKQFRSFRSHIGA